jgi:hypothetical protein
MNSIIKIAKKGLNKIPLHPKGNVNAKKIKRERRPKILFVI